ncbi:MAG TPA: protein phosphatase CheZ [Steroidobacteraceae bacterium]|nr:protein phosphatase CheZ [Steroidobacteraceae bacterium]
MHGAEFMARHRGVMAQLNHAYAIGDEAAFELLVSELHAEREQAMRTGIARLSQSLADALLRFQLDSRIAALAAHEIPDARLRLDHVLKLTEEAAHRTLDIIEQTAPLAESTAADARTLSNTLDERSHSEIRRFLGEVQGSAERVRANLTEVMLAQGYQDLTGQILNGIRTLIGEVESVLDELARFSGVDLRSVPRTEGPGLQGPAVPGVGTGAIVDQTAVDDLIAGLGV